MKKIRHILEATLMLFFISIFRILPFKHASNFGSLIASSIGPKLKFHKRARNNIEIAFPKIREQDAQNILTKMWDNLGRSIAEFPNIFNLSNQEYEKLVKINGKENLDLLKDGGLIFSAHIANWEIVPYIFRDLNKEIFIVYRPSNNVYIDKIINKYRNMNNLNFIPKGKDGAKQIIRQLRNKNIVIMLADQRMRDGIEVPFFDVPAFTAPAIASLAIQFNLPLMPIYSQRVYNSLHKFEIYIEKPLNIKFNKSKADATYDALLQVNQNVELWVKNDPGQWFWIHNRWAKGKTH